MTKKEIENEIEQKLDELIALTKENDPSLCSCLRIVSAARLIYAQDILCMYMGSISESVLMPMVEDAERKMKVRQN